MSDSNDVLYWIYGLSYQIKESSFSQELDYASLGNRFKEGPQWFSCVVFITNLLWHSTLQEHVRNTMQASGIVSKRVLNDSAVQYSSRICCDAVHSRSMCAMVRVWPQCWQEFGGPRDKMCDFVALVWPIQSLVITTSSALVRCLNSLGGPSVGTGVIMMSWCEILRKWVNWTLRWQGYLWYWPLTINVKLYHGNRRPKCHGTKGTGVDRTTWCERLRRWVDWMLCWLAHVWPWALTFKTKLFLGNGRPDCHGTQGTGVDRMLWYETRPQCDLKAKDTFRDLWCRRFRRLVEFYDTPLWFSVINKVSESFHSVMTKTVLTCLQRHFGLG